MKKHDRPSIVWASSRKASLVGADRNHLCPVSRHMRSPASIAWVLLASRSLPPCFSVMPMPTVTPALSVTGRAEESYLRLRMSGSQRSVSDALLASAATAALVMLIGLMCPASTCAAM